MSNYRVAVYAISKNEEKFVDRWMESMSEADEIMVLDTGSTDGTVERLRARGARVFQQEFHPWRFDVARNRALELVSEDVDICCSIDLDEVFEPGWRQALEKAWAKGADQLQYRYTWNFDEQGNELTVFFADKITAKWISFGKIHVPQWFFKFQCKQKKVSCNFFATHRLASNMVLSFSAVR